MIRPATSLPPDQTLKPSSFSCDELSLNQLGRKKTAGTRPRTGNRRNPLLHQAIIEAATEVLAKEGPTQFTIEAVAKLAGCGKPTICRWWPCRSALLLEVYEQSVKQELVEPEGKDLAKDLAAMLRKIWGLWGKGCRSSLYRLILSETMRTAVSKCGCRLAARVASPSSETVH
jgi:AcrR family transcriptional regulator